ncbi:hypothetical protein [Methylibium petroleiphilum]|uniref:hypothetical protein n=1 Tax=Methylibium petroleiphilum TaxID=105560 RepID=UPI003D275AD3
MTISLGSTLEGIQREIETEAQAVDELRVELAGLRRKLTAAERLVLTRPALSAHVVHMIALQPAWMLRFRKAQRATLLRQSKEMLLHRPELNRGQIFGRRIGFQLLRVRLQHALDLNAVAQESS